MDSKLPIDILENVMQLATEGCKAIANYIREVRTCLSYVIDLGSNIMFHIHFIA
jgi:exosome complex component RRP41